RARHERIDDLERHLAAAAGALAAKIEGERRAKVRSREGKDRAMRRFAARFGAKDGKDTGALVESCRQQGTRVETAFLRLQVRDTHQAARGARALRIDQKSAQGTGAVELHVDPRAV